MNWPNISKRVREHVWGPIGSVVFHCLLITLLVAWARHEPQQKWHDEPTLTDFRNDTKVFTPDPPLQPPRELDRLDPASTGENTGPDSGVMKTIEQTVAESLDGSVAESGAMDIAFSKSPLTLDLSVLDLPGSLGDRMKLKSAALGNGPPGSSSHGPSGHAPDTEITIHRALDWLKNHQLEDGSWGPNQIGMTGLALLTFLGHGDTSGSREYGATVRKAIAFLAAHQQENGLFSMAKQMSQPSVYEHAIATYAMSEAYGMTRQPDLKELMEKAAAVIVQGQQPGGLWNYEYKKDARWDTSVSGWQIQALKAAIINGAEVPGMAEAFAKSADGLKQAQAPDTGRFGYAQPGQGNIGMTGVGALCLQIAGQLKQPQTRAGLLALRDTGCEWQRPAPWPMYTWYYVTQALYHDHGPAWDSWNRKVVREFTRNQNPDGSWASPAGSGYENEETKHGPVYSTTLALLTLEAPYRYAPVSQSMQEQKRKRAAPASDAVNVDII